jgi:predicted RNase H-like nuclease (RuvC/YqgF family)
MKWKDTGDVRDSGPAEGDPYYNDDEGFASFSAKGVNKLRRLSAKAAGYLFGGLGLVIVVLLIVLLSTRRNASVDPARIADLQQRVANLQQQLDKYAGVDEKVTRIWEQAKTFETFKTRFDRSESSTSLRMDHLSMSLDALQKKVNEFQAKLAGLEKAPGGRAASAGPPVAKKKRVSKKKATAKTHTVVAGDTLYSISRRYHLSVAKLRSINNLNKRAVIHVGQKLIVSLSGH